jgi:hypothetical protein
MPGNVIHVRYWPRTSEGREAFRQVWHHARMSGTPGYITLDLKVGSIDWDFYVEQERRAAAKRGEISA